MASPGDKRARQTSSSSDDQHSPFKDKSSLGKMDGKHKNGDGATKMGFFSKFTKHDSKDTQSSTASAHPTHAPLEDEARFGSPVEQHLPSKDKSPPGKIDSKNKSPSNGDGATGTKKGGFFSKFTKHDSKGTHLATTSTSSVHTAIEDVPRSKSLDLPSDSTSPSDPSRERCYSETGIESVFSSPEKERARNPQHFAWAKMYQLKVDKEGKVLPLELRSSSGSVTHSTTSPTKRSGHAVDITHLEIEAKAKAKAEAKAAKKSKKKVGVGAKNPPISPPAQYGAGTSTSGASYNPGAAADHIATRKDTLPPSGRSPTKLLTSPRKQKLKISPKPKCPGETDRSISPPNSPQADRSQLSPLKLQQQHSAEPRSAPPGYHRSGSLPTSESHSHAAILHRVKNSFDNNRMEIEDLDENTDQAYSKFMKAHKCYDLIPTSAKLVIFDTQLNVKKAFFALVYNGVRAAPLWDSTKQDYVGMITVTDFIQILKRYYKSPDMRMDELEDHRIAKWREVLEEKQSLISISPDASLFEALTVLTKHHVHRLPVIDDSTGNALFILTHKRILRFLHLYIKEMPKPDFLTQSIGKLNIGTYENVITATEQTPLINALNLFVKHRISALPVIDGSGQVKSIYAKFDVINLAADKSYNNLDITLGEALRQRHEDQDLGPLPDRVATCLLSDTLGQVMEKIVKAEVHRLVVVDIYNSIEGILSLSDLLKYIILRPIDEAADQAQADTPDRAQAPTSNAESMTTS